MMHGQKNIKICRLIFVLHISVFATYALSISDAVHHTASCFLRTNTHIIYKHTHWSRLFSHTQSRLRQEAEPERTSIQNYN